MKIAVLSGKGGTGKTFVSVNLASSRQGTAYVDCDVEAPNGALFLKPESVTQQEVSVPVPQVNRTRCNGCRKCVEFCQYNALAWAGSKIMLFEKLCHYCGGCEIVCAQKAIEEKSRVIGAIEEGYCGASHVISGLLNPGEISGLPIIAQLLSRVASEQDVVIDCPPGCSCHTIHSIRDADVCILVAEPTLFGIHDLEMVYQLVQLYNKPFGVVINKSLDVRNYVKTFCKNNKVKILAEIPYKEELACLIAEGQLVSGMPEYAKIFTKIYKNALAAYQGV